MKNNNAANAAALANPKPGDFWHEMFCPYFIVVGVSRDKITVLNTVIRSDDGYYFDYDKVNVVDKAWLKNRVRYATIDAFVADVVSTDATKQIVDQWREHTSQTLKQAIATAQKEWEDFTGWTILKQEEFNA
jgi:hypothetical protein